MARPSTRHDPWGGSGTGEGWKRGRGPSAFFWEGCGSVDDLRSAREQADRTPCDLEIHPLTRVEASGICRCARRPASSRVLKEELAYGATEQRRGSMISVPPL